MWPSRSFRIAQKLTATEDVAQGKKEAIPRYIDQKQQQYISLYQLVEEFNHFVRRKATVYPVLANSGLPHDIYEMATVLSYCPRRGMTIPI